jgi:ABC-type glycerol-3-phosphate transport system substrate-binding protein
VTLTASSKKEEETSVANEALEILGDAKWSEYKEKFGSQPNYTGDDIVINAANAIALPEGAKVLAELGGKTNVLYLPSEGGATWTVTVPETGLYAIDLSFYAISELNGEKVSKAADIERTLRINGEVPFTEVRNLLMTKTWIDVLSDDQIVYDQNGNITDIIYDQDSVGNDRRPTKVEAPEWRKYTVCDPTGYYNGEFFFYLEAGENTITLEAQKEPVALESITLRERKELLTYEEYIAMHVDQGVTRAPQDFIISLEAEFATATSSSTIYGQNDSTSSITSPQHASYSWINDIGGRNGSYNWSSVGQWIEWTVNIPEGKGGFYTISSRFLSSALEGLFVSRRLYIDGEIPFEEANNLEFIYDKGWQGGTFTDGTTEFEFYLEGGKTHTFKLEVNYGNLGGLIAEVRECVTRINEIYITILQISGTDPDPYMDYSYYKRIPDEIAEMNTLARRLYAVSEQIQQISDGKSSSATATIENVARVLETMAADSERQIAKNFSALKSYIGNLGTWLNDIGQQALILDYFVIQPAGNELPKGEGNFFQSAWFEIQKFVYSFIRDNSSFGSAEAGEGVTKIEVWTTVSREYAQIIRSIVDESFGREHPDIAINLKLVTAGTLLPATLSGVGPDVMMDVTSSDCVNYAVRGAVLDLSKYEGFDELKTYFHESAWVPVTVALDSVDGEIAVYGVPEKQSFSVMFYRKDIFASLDLKVPNTWDEFNAIMPILVSQNYLVGMPHDTTITNMFIYQNGGSLYSNGGTTISFDQDITLDAFTQLCTFFTTYRFPLTYDAANRFRSGEMPVFIGDYITFYNQFTIFAPELKGLWGFTTVPGTVQEDGSINKSVMAAINSIVIMMDAADRGTDEAGFKFIKWWMGATVQGQYANELVALLGPAGKYATANMDAFNDMSWTASELKEIQNQFSNLQAVPEMPGSYIIARNVEFAFLNVYNNDYVPSEALQDYTNTINAEFQRKRDELKRKFFVPSNTK